MRRQEWGRDQWAALAALVVTFVAIIVIGVSR